MTSSGSGATPSGTSWVRSSLRPFTCALTHASTIAGAVAGALLAPECVACGLPLSGATGGPVCGSCWNRLSLLSGQRCGVCGVSLALAPDTRPGFAPCRCSPGALASVNAWGSYDGMLRTLIHAMKYDGYASIATHLGALIRPDVREVLVGAHAIVPVPLHPLKRLQRGFNQADLIARELGLPVLRVLRRRRWTHSQTRLRAGGRQRNVENAFGLTWPRRRETSARLRNGVLVLVDDVRTTGSTLEACAAVLRGVGAAEVRALVVARADLSRPHGPAAR